MGIGDLIFTVGTTLSEPGDPAEATQTSRAETP
jgi:hypothetical protein